VKKKVADYGQNELHRGDGHLLSRELSND